MAVASWVSEYMNIPTVGLQLGHLGDVNRYSECIDPQPHVLTLINSGDMLNMRDNTD